jgi:hypothetical protein
MYYSQGAKVCYRIGRLVHRSIEDVLNIVCTQNYGACGAAEGGGVHGLLSEAGACALRAASHQPEPMTYGTIGVTSMDVRIHALVWTAPDTHEKQCGGDMAARGCEQPTVKCSQIQPNTGTVVDCIQLYLAIGYS